VANEDEVGFSRVVQALTELRTQAIAQLRSPATRENALQKKLEIDRALDVLSQAVRLGLSGCEKSWTMPDCRTPTPSSEYRVLEDNETERREHWTEVVVDGERLRLQPGDVILRRH